MFRSAQARSVFELINRNGLDRAARRRIDRERPGVGEQVEESLAGRQPADHRADDTLIQKQPHVEALGEMHLEAESPLADHRHRGLGTQAFVLHVATLALMPFEKDILGRHGADLARGPLHQVEPVGVLGGRPLMGPFALDHVHVVFVAIDHQRNFGNVALVKPKTGNALLCRPPPQMVNPLLQSAPKQFGLFAGLGRQTAESRTVWRGSLPAATAELAGAGGDPAGNGRFRRSDFSGTGRGPAPGVSLRRPGFGP